MVNTSEGRREWELLFYNEEWWYFLVLPLVICPADIIYFAEDRSPASASRASRETLFVSRAVQLSKFIGRMACAFRRPWFSSARWPCRGVFPLVFFFNVSRLSGKDIISQIETMLVIFYQILGIAKVGIPIFSVVLRNNILPLRRWSSLLLITDTPVWQSWGYSRTFISIQYNTKETTISKRTPDLRRSSRCEHGE